MQGKAIWGCAAALLSTSGLALGQPAAPAAENVTAKAETTQLERVEVRGNYDNAVGTSDAASQGQVTSRLIESRPTLRPAEVLEFVPGVIVTQHSGDGKANQYFLRGFNLDHGTDFAMFVDGMPVNMPTHAHGQGYSDLNFVIPELIDRIAYKKGPYYADEGDFSSAGAAHLFLVDRLQRGIGVATVGQYGYRRGLLASSSEAGPGALTCAVEVAHNDGPWDNPERFHRFTGLVRYAFGEAEARSSITGMAYSAGWNATDQIPLRAVTEGLIDRFGAIDPTDHGSTARYSLSYGTERNLGDGTFRLTAYAISSRLDLFSDFTFFLEHPSDLGPAANPSGIDGDQFEQSEHRKVFGLSTERSWNATLLGADSTTTLGLQARHDRLDPVGLYAAAGGRRVATTQESIVRETSAALYAENATRWASWLRTLVGVRADEFHFDVTSSIPENSGNASAGIASPKAALIFGPWASTEYFINYGWGYHSNDARGTTETLTPKERAPAEPVTSLVRSKGGEVGLRTEIVPGLQSSVALWQLRLASELVFSGDAGDTEPNRPSERYGIEWSNHYVARPWLLLDLDVAASHARFTQSLFDENGAEVGNYIPGSIDRVASFGVTVTELGHWVGQFQVRYFGPRPLIEDNSQRSQATTLAYARVGYRITRDVKVNVDVFNLFDRKASDIDYYYASRLPGDACVRSAVTEPCAGTNDIHFHPVEPRSFRVTLTGDF